jgi:hypothetical protein
VVANNIGARGRSLNRAIDTLAAGPHPAIEGLQRRCPPPVGRRCRLRRLAAVPSDVAIFRFARRRGMGIRCDSQVLNPE